MQFKTLFKRFVMPVLALFIVFQLSACGDGDKDQRNAFISYLQNTVMRGSNIVPTLSEDQRQKLGHYTSDYAILVSFSQSLSSSMSGSLDALFNTLSQIRVPQDYMTHREALRQEIDALNTLGQQLQSAKMQADNAKNALKQPDDLKPVFDQAYDKVVNNPINAAMPLIPAAASLAQDLIQVGDFLQSQGAQVRFENQSVQFSNQAAVEQYNQMMSAVSAKYQSLMAEKNRNASILQNQ